MTTDRMTAEDAAKYLLGDLTRLTPAELGAYYLRVCDALGVDARTRPLEYIDLLDPQGRTRRVLYARRDCADQLRRKHGISITDLRCERHEDGTFVVTVRAQAANGRTDADIGAVVPRPRARAGTLTPTDVANAMMAAVTKAKRRVTLSLCGLGMLDETEIDDLRRDGAILDSRIEVVFPPEHTDAPRAPNPAPTAAPERAPATAPEPLAAAAPEPVPDPTPPRTPDDHVRASMARTGSWRAPRCPACAHAISYDEEAGAFPCPHCQVRWYRVTERQRKMLFARARAAGIPDARLSAYMREQFAIESTAELLTCRSRRDGTFDLLLEAVATGTIPTKPSDDEEPEVPHDNA